MLFVDGSGAFHPDGLSGPSPAANQTSAEASVIDLPHSKGRASASLWRCAMPQMAARIFQPDAKLCYAMRLTIMSAAWIYGSRIAGDADQVAGMIAPSLRGVLVFACPGPPLATRFIRISLTGCYTLRIAMPGRVEERVLCSTKFHSKTTQHPAQ